MNPLENETIAEVRFLTKKIQDLSNHAAYCIDMDWNSNDIKHITPELIKDSLKNLRECMELLNKQEKWLNALLSTKG